MTSSFSSLRETVNAALLAWPRVVAGSVFGSPGYYVKGRAFAFWDGEVPVIKLPPAGQAAALGIPGARRYTVPRGASVEWVLIPRNDELPATEVTQLLRSSYEYVGGEPALR